jgi:hypothetical protein
MISKIVYKITLLGLLLLTGCSAHQKSQGNVLVIMNSSSTYYSVGNTYIIPYLDHFGLPYSVIDIAKEKISGSFTKNALIIIAHKEIEQGVKELIKPRILEAVNSGTGLVSFDFHFSLQEEYKPVEYNRVRNISFSKSENYIVSSHEPSDTITLFGEMSLPKIPDQNNMLLSGDSLHPLLIITQKEKGRIVTWTSMDWMQTAVSGPLGGLDDCLWRSFVWAAKKPFALRGLAPVVTMRVDDVSGQGEEFWGESPLYWVKTANKYGLKPYLSLFIYNLRPGAIEELRGYLLNGQATAAPHAFGRPPRTEMSGFKSDYFTENIDSGYYKGYYYYPEGLPFRTEEYDEFIYFNWHEQKPWSDSVVQSGLQAVDEWYKKHQPLPMSKYLVPHWYEMGENVIPWIADRWGIEFVGIVMAPGMNYSGYIPWLKAGPFRLFEEPGASAFIKELRAQHPVYYADFIRYGERQLFNCVTEIRDDAGYEWAPDNDVQASTGRGIRQLKRALNSMAPAVLFTHETDFIYKIKPENWDLELKGVLEGI